MSIINPSTQIPHMLSTIWVAPTAVTNTRCVVRGLRVCPAQQFALATVGYVITRMLQTFKGFESRDDRDYIPWIRLSTSNYNGYHVALVPDEPR